MSSSPQVSVVMTVWNGRKYIAESIESIVRQTFRDLELIIIDDGSTDDTCQIVESFDDPRIRLIRRPHLGVVPSANFGVSQARGKYIARLDADDISLPERIERQVAALEKNAKAVLCYTDVEIFGENIFGDVSTAHKAARFCLDTAYFNVVMCFRFPFIHSSLMFRKETIDCLGGYRDRHPCEDFDLCARLIQIGSFVGIPMKLVRYRRHLESATCRRLEEMERISREICERHIQGFLKVSVPQVQEIFQMFKVPPARRKWKTWLFFCRRVLRHPASWRPEPLGWLVVNTGKIVRGAAA